MKVLSPAEQVALLGAADSKICLRNQMIIRTFLLTGLRVSELCGLINDDIYFGADVKKFLVVRSEISKGGRSREIPLAEKLRDDFRKYRQSHVHNNVAVDADPARPLFPSFQDMGVPVTVRQVQRIVSCLGKIIGIPDLHPHMLRHTFATSLMRNTDMRTVQALLGHASLQSTQVYTHPDSNDMAKAVNGL